MQALVAAAIAPDPSGDDRTLLGLELDRRDEPRAAGERRSPPPDINPGGIILRRDPGAPARGADRSQRPGFGAGPAAWANSAAGRAPAGVLGGYAVPIGSQPMTSPLPRPEVLRISPYVGGESQSSRSQPYHQAVIERGRVRHAARRAGGGPGGSRGDVPLSGRRRARAAAGDRRPVRPRSGAGSSAAPGRTS